VRAITFSYSLAHLIYVLLLTLHRMPLCHFATADLLADTIAPESSDANAVIALRSDSA
jgi:hypothetical protein